MGLLEENYNPLKHIHLQSGLDAFGHKVEPEDGYRLVEVGERLEKGDKHFDIYSGWQDGNEGPLIGVEMFYLGGRWTAWERKVD